MPEHVGSCPLVVKVRRSDQSRELAIQPIDVPGVNVVLQDESKVVCVLSRMSPPAILPSRELQQGESWQGNAFHENILGKVNRQCRFHYLFEAEQRHHDIPVGRPLDSAVTTLDPTEGNDVHFESRSELELVQALRNFDEGPALEEAFPQCMKLIPGFHAKRKVDIRRLPPSGNVMRVLEQKIPGLRAGKDERKLVGDFPYRRD